MTISNKMVAQHFWDKSDTSAQSKSMSYDGIGKLFSYNTVILQRDGDVVIGNTTKYSHTTSAHQGLAHVSNADMFQTRIHRGCQDLRR